MIKRFYWRARAKLLTWRALIFWRPRLWLAARRGRFMFPDHINARCTLHPVDPEPFGVLHGVHDYPPPVLQWDDLAQAHRTIYLAEIPPPHVWLGDDDKLI